MSQLSSNFTSEEFVCQHCGRNGVRPELIAALQELRSLTGMPVRITSGYRCPRHPIEAGKKKPGYHALGLAADVQVPGLPLQRLYEIVRSIPAFRGIGVDVRKQYIHLDVRRPPAPPFQWRYHARGWSAWNGDWSELQAG